MIYRVLSYLRNFFVKEIHKGDFTIEGGSPVLPFLRENQYFRIIGSALNDGVYRYPARDLKDEEFTGEVWRLAIPPEVIELIGEIERYGKSTDGRISPYTSESWGGYSYTKATGRDGAPVSWQAMFAKKLNPWRKL